MDQELKVQQKRELEKKEETTVPARNAGCRERKC